MTLLTLSQIASVVDAIAPFRLAYDWDNCGLQIGDPNQPVEKLLIALEINSAVIAYARKKSCRAILVHHPLIFQAQKSVRSDTLSGGLQLELIRAGIGLIAAHTNVDRVLRGTNGALAERIGLQNVTILEPGPGDESYKFTVFVPRDHTPAIIEAIHRGGGGRIGLYSHCTFRAPGTGTYVPESGAKPFAGRVGKFEEAAEDRLETLVPKSALPSVIREVLAAHPYEEVAYDVYALHDPNIKYGLGVCGVLPRRTTLRELAEALCSRCSTPFACIAGKPGRAVQKIAIITGSAGSSVRAISPAVADAVVTGELSYHFTQEAVARGLAVVTIGHAASEKIFAGHFAREMRKEPVIANSNLKIEAYEKFDEMLLPVLAPGKRK